MKVFILFAVFSLSALVAATSSALPVQFERSFRNYAWSIRNDGCFVDEQRYLYTYNEVKGGPIENIGRVSPDDFQKGLSLLANIYRTKFIPGSIAFDAGVLVWRGYVLGEPFDIKKQGDSSGQRDSPLVSELVELINSWCPKELLPSMPHQ